MPDDALDALENRGAAEHEWLMPIDWKYYVVEHAFVVRADLKEIYAERLMRDGRWVEFRDTMDITYNGRQIAGEAEAMAAARELFAMYPELS